MDIYDLFSKFELDILPKEWVQNLWKDDFSEAVDFPSVYEEYLENADIGELMSAATVFIKEWLESEANDNSIHRPSISLNRLSLNASFVDSKSWQNLISNNVQHKSLVAVLSIFILRGKTEKQYDVKRLGLLATDLYFMLLAIPGSQVFHIFNPILYSHAVENLKICNTLVNSSSSAKPPAKKKRARQDDDDEFEDEEEGNESDSEGVLLPMEKSAVTKMLNNILSNFHFMLKKFQLKGQDDSLLITIQILILITRLERNSSTLLSKSPAHNSISYLSYKSYRILLDLYRPDHGEDKNLIKITMRELMASLLIFDQKNLKLSPKEVLVVKDHSMQFIRNLLRVIKDPAYDGVYTLFQHICIRIPDKADLRAKGVQVVTELLDILPYSLYSRSVIWIMSLCHNDQVKNRITGLDIITKLLYGSERVPTSPLKAVPERDTGQVDAGEDEEDTEDSGLALTQQADFSTMKFQLATVFSRCQDSASSVRAKALSILANLISSSNRNIKHEMESIFVTPYLNSDSIENCKIYDKDFFDFHHFLKNMKEETNASLDPLPGAKAIISLIELFIEDEKVFVRKSSLQVLANIFLMSEKWMSKKLLEVIVTNCRDISVSIRKLLVQCLTDLLLRYPTHVLLRNYWVKGVLPLLADQELKSQEKVLEVVQNTILDNLVPYKQMKTDLHALPWQLLNVLAQQNKRKLFLFACHKWSLNNVLRQNLITTIKTHIGTENNIEAWFLLASFSEYLDIKDPQFVLDYFYENVLNSQQVDEYCCQLVTEVMHLSWRQLPTDCQITLCDTLLRHLAQFTIPLPMIGRCIDICQLTTEAHADTPELAREHVKQWAAKLISVCESGLEKTVGLGCPETVEDEARLSQYIFTVGDAAQICPAQFKHSSLLLIQNLLTGDEGEDEEDGEEKRWQGKVSAGVQAVSVVTLGKLCLQREHTAKVLVPLFGSLLSDTPHTEIKINAMIALTDMCIKFTSLVEKHLPDMCICLRDKDLQVRENTLTLLIQLIQEDYLKLRPPMFFHLLTTLGDQEQLIRDLTSSFIINSLLVKQKNYLIQYFVEGLFHYNAYVGHSSYSKCRVMSARERAVFCLSGTEGEAARRHIYRFMLENMIDEHRFKITYRLCTEILASVAEGETELSASGTTLLQDALYVLSCDEIRLAHLRPTSKDADDDDDRGGGEMAQVAEAINNLARKTLVSQVVKKNMIENIVPIFIKLKHKLQQIKSPLVRDLMACLRELMKDYKTEINEILAADKELAAEILHDLQISGQQEEDEEDRPEIASDEVLKKAVMEVVALNEARKSLRSPGTPRRSRTKRLSGSPPPSKSQNTSPLTQISPTTSSPAGNLDVPNSTPQANNKNSSPSGSSVQSNSPSETAGVRKSLSKQRSNRLSTSSTSSSASSHSKKSSRTRKKK